MQVLDRGFVELQDVMGNDLAIVNAARTSYLGESKGVDADRKLLAYLYKHKHFSPFEMCQVKMLIHAPLMVWQHILRHRTGSFNLQSFRYTEAKDEFYFPEVLRKQDSKNKQGSYGEVEDKVLLNDLAHHYEKGLRLYDKMLEKGVAKEMARLALPAFALYSLGVVSFDLRNLLHLIDLRDSDDAQWETRQYAIAMKEILKEKFPWTMELVESHSVQ